MEDKRKLNRRAARAVLEPFLSDDDLDAAIRLLENNYLLENATGVIDFLDEVGERFQIDHSDRKLLYIRLYELVSQRDAVPLPPDPFGDVASEATPNDQPAPLRILGMQSPRTEKAPPVAPTPSPISTPYKVFIAFYRELLKKLRSQPFTVLQTYFTMCDELSQEHDFVWLRPKITPLWKRPESLRWVSSLSESELTRLTQLIYLSICVAIGPRETERLFRNASNICEKHLPEAKIFTPSQLLEPDVSQTLKKESLA